MKKRFMALLMVAALATGVLAGCAQKEDTTSTTNSGTQSTETTTTTPDSGTSTDTTSDVVFSGDGESYTVTDLAGTWAFAEAVLADGTSLDPAEYAKENELPDDILTYGVLVMKLVFDENGNVTESVNDETTDEGTYTFDGHVASIDFQSGETIEAEMGDILLAGEMTTTIAVTNADTNTTMIYAKL